MKKKILQTIIVLLTIVTLTIPQVQVSALPVLTVTPITWNVIGLDSNKVTSGPNQFPIGVRVCNTGNTTATNVSANFAWDNTPVPNYINTRPGTLTTLTSPSITAGTCQDFYFEVEVTRDSNAYDTTRRYHIAVTADGGISTSSPTPRELYVEHLVSQSRNAVMDIKLDGVSIAPGGTMSMVIGNEYTVDLIGYTATQGYNQLESFINFPNIIIQVLEVKSTFSAGTSPITTLYADSCTWDNIIGSPSYRSCIGSDLKSGGNVDIQYKIKVISAPNAPLVNPEPLQSLIYDFSGSSYHYNSDYSISGRLVYVTNPADISISKAFLPATTSPGGISNLTITLNNASPVTVNDVNFSDSLPSLSGGQMLVAATPGVTTSGCGTPVFSPLAGDTVLNFSKGTIAPNGSCTISVSVSVPANPTTGIYHNSITDLAVGANLTGHSASADLTLATGTTGSGLCGISLASWNFTGKTNGALGMPVNADASIIGTAQMNKGSTLAIEADTSIGNPLPSIRTYGWPKTSLDANAYITFSANVSNYTQVAIKFDSQRKANGTTTNYVLVSSDGGITWYQDPTTFNPPTSGWTTYTYTFTGRTSTNAGTPTLFKITGYGANATSTGNDTSFDNFSITGCGAALKPTIKKSFSPNPILVGGTSRLTFTLENPNDAVLTGAKFIDNLPAGLKVAATPSPSTTCTGTPAPSWAPAANDTSLSFGQVNGADIPAKSGSTNGSCTVSVNVTATTSGPHANVSDVISTTQSGTNNGEGGTAQAGLSALLPPTIEKVFNPDTLLPGGISTLTFIISNPNPNDALPAVAFSDTFPTSPGAMKVAATPNASTTDCGSPTFSPAANAASLSFSGGTVAAGGTCLVRVDVTVPMGITGPYQNTSNAVTTTISGTTTGTDTASASITVQSPSPSINILKQVGRTNTGPWSNYLATTVGGYVFYRIVVENTGDVPFSPVSVNDPDVTLCTTLQWQASNPSWPTLPVASRTQDPTASCIVGPFLASEGTHTNTATVDGTYNSTHYTDTSTAKYQTTGLSLEKSATESKFSTAGDVLHYSYTVSNTGYAPLYGPVVINDDKSSDESCPELNTIGNHDDFLDRGESIVCSATYTVTTQDVTNGSVTNLATATVAGLTSNQASKTLGLLPSLTIVKSHTDVFVRGALADYHIVVSNAAGVGPTFGEVTVTDTLPTGLTLNDTPYGTGWVCTGNTGDSSFSCTRSDELLGGASYPTITVTVKIDPATADSVTNTATVSGGGDASDSSDDDQTNIITDSRPGLSVVKSETSSGPYVKDGTISFSIVVTNTGNTTLTNVGLTDANASLGTCTPAQPASLAPADSMTCPATHTVSQADLDAGSYKNMATATSTETGDKDSNEITVNFTQSPSLSVVKSETSTGPYIKDGTISFSIVVTNTGNTTLTNVGLTDANASLGTCTPAQPASLAPADSMTCPATHTVSQADLDAGSYKNMATATSTETGDKDSNEITVNFTQSPSLSVVKSETSSGPYIKDGTISFSIVVTNTGNTTLTNVGLTDANASLGTCTPAQPASLAPADSMTCPATHTVSQADLDAGSYKNMATATSTETGDKDSNEITVNFTQSPSLSVVKSETSSGPYVKDGTISFSIVVTNTGNTTLTNVGLTDANASLGTCTPAQPASLAPADSMTCPATHTVSQADLDAGSYKNMATATSTETGDKDSNEITVNFTQSPSLSVVKSETSSGPYVKDGTISFSIVVTNTGNTTLTNVGLTDANASLGTCTPAQPASLAPADSMTCPATHTVSQADLDAGSYKNMATATSTETGDKDSNEITVNFTQSPSLSVVKSETSSGPYVKDGTISFSIVVTNTGNTTLTNVGLTDANASLGTCTPAQPASLAPADSMTCPATHTVSQADLDAGSYKNMATATSTETGDKDSNEVTVTFPSHALIGLAKALVQVTKVSDGTYDLTFSFLVRNYGNVDLTNIQVTDDLSSTFPSPSSFEVRSLSSPDFAVNWSSPGQPSDFNGTTIQELLKTGVDLPIEASGSIQLVVRVIPASSGPFYNSATASGQPPSGDRVSDTSSDGTDPDQTSDCQTCTNGDGDPTNNTKPTPVQFDDNLLNPPSGKKTVDSTDAPILMWKMEWVNNNNLVPLLSIVHDPIPMGTTYSKTGLSSGYPVPQGAPFGSTNVGLSCTAASNATITSLCYYEGPTFSHPLGQIIWAGTLASDYGVSDPSNGSNRITIAFKLNLVQGFTTVTNVASVDADLNGDGDTSDDNEQNVISVQEVFEEEDQINIPPETHLPESGFAPGRVSSLPVQPDNQKYSPLSANPSLEIPSLGVNINIFGIPFRDKKWDVSWLWNQAGWLEGSAYPTSSGNSVLTAHVYLSDGTPGPFLNLAKMSTGQRIIINNNGVNYTYIVQEVRTILPSDLTAFQHKEGSWLTLVTCQGYSQVNNTYQYRVMVSARLESTFIEIRSLSR